MVSKNIGHRRGPKSIVYAMFSRDVSAADKYKVTTPPSKFFRTRKEAMGYVKAHKVKDVKILSYNLQRFY